MCRLLGPLLSLCLVSALPSPLCGYCTTSHTFLAPITREACGSSGVFSESLETGVPNFEQITVAGAGSRALIVQTWSHDCPRGGVCCLNPWESRGKSESSEENQAAAVRRSYRAPLPSLFPGPLPYPVPHSFPPVSLQHLPAMSSLKYLQWFLVTYRAKHRPLRPVYTAPPPSRYVLVSLLSPCTS